MEKPKGEESKNYLHVCWGQSAAMIVPLIVTLSIILFLEFERFFNLPKSTSFPFGWLTNMNIDSTPYLMWFLLLPLFWFMRHPIPLQEIGKSLSERWFVSFVDTNSSESFHVTHRTWLLSLLVGMTALSVSVRIGADPLPGSHDSVSFVDLPPAYHDEFSYLFQADTFLEREFSFESHQTHPEIFNQMHVINEGRFASRYFLGTGLWMAPFQAMGHPWWGHWLAGALSAMFLFWAGRELGGDVTGFLAGMLLALSPGVALFSNLLLAHHPTLLGLTLFLFAFLRLMRTSNKKYALLAGVGLGFAMICRPMTAAGFGFPFGLWFFLNLFRNSQSSSLTTIKQKVLLVVAMGIPLLAGGGLLLIQNQAITGKMLLSPYQVYNDTYTPRHVYGFHNVTRGEQHLGPKVIKKYDTWAKNLTPSLAWDNEKKRSIASMQWTFGLVPLLLAGFYFVVRWNRQSIPLKLIFCSIVMLHVVHIPYWFVGIMNWHYVFETAPLWLLIFAVTSRQLFQFWQQAERTWMSVWWCGLIVIALVTGLMTIAPFWKTSRLKAGIAEVRFARGRYYFAELIIQEKVKQPALVLFQQSESDSSMDYVFNHPSLQSQILRGHLPGQSLTDQETLNNIKQISAQFPKRSIYLFRVDVPPDQWRCVPILIR